MSTMVMFDTHALVRKLKMSGMPESQAEALAEAQVSVMEQVSVSAFATKTDIGEVKEQINALRTETVRMFGDLRAEMHNALRLQALAIVGSVVGLVALLKVFT